MGLRVLLQDKSNGKDICMLDDSEVTFPFWKKYHVDADIDMMWTFDFVEYQLAWKNGYTWDHIINRIHDEKPEQGGYLLDMNSTSIV